MLEGLVDELLELWEFHLSGFVGIEHLYELSTLVLVDLDTALLEDLVELLAADLS